MSFSDRLLNSKRIKTTTSSGFSSRLKPKTTSKTDLSTLEGLTQVAREAGLEKEIASIIDTRPKLSFLQRLGKGLGAFNPAEALLTGQEKGAGAAVVEYPKRIIQGLGSAVTGRDYGGEQRTFSDVVEKLGVDNAILKHGIGFVGDVLLDPSTYFGGAIARGISTGVRGTSKVALRGIGKVAPKTEEGLKLAGTGLVDAVGRAFKYAYKSSKGAKEDILSFMTRSQQAKFGLAASNLERLGSKILTQSQKEELALKMIAGKRAEFTAREIGKSIEEAGQIAKQTALTGTSKKVSGVIEKQIARSQKIGEQIGLKNPYEVYFPFIKSDKVKRFLNETKGIQVGSQGYLKKFKNILTNENMELDPAVSFFTRESQIVTDKMTSDFLSGFTRKYGKPLNSFKNSDDAVKAGYQLLKDKGMFGKELGYIKDFDSKLLRDSISPEFQTLNMIAKATGFDAITSLFKRSVTGLFAPFHVRNYVSGIIQNFETLGIQALKPRNMNIGRKIAFYMGKGKDLPPGIITLGGKSAKFKDIMKPFVERFSGDTFYNADFDLSLRAGSELKQVSGLFSKTRIGETIKTAGLGTEAIPFKVGRAVGQFIEHQQKATAYVTALGQGKNIKEALQLAETAGFDYRALTKFESQIMRRFIPFYSFARKNLELQLKTLGTNPQRINQVLKFFQSAGGMMGGGKTTEEERNVMPDFIKESLGVKLQDTPEGLKQYIASFGTPIEAFTQLFESNPILRALSMTNPLIKTPVELGIGKDSFRKRDLKDVYTANEYKLAPQFVKDLLSLKEVKKPVYKTFNGESRKVGERITYVADPVKLLIARSLFTSRGVSYLDQVFGGDLKGFVKLLKTTTGIKPQQVDIESQKYFSERDKKRAVQDVLNRYGVGSKFEQFYIPK